MSILEKWVLKYKEEWKLPLIFAINSTSKSLEWPKQGWYHTHQGQICIIHHVGLELKEHSSAHQQSSRKENRLPRSESSSAAAAAH